MYETEKEIIYEVKDFLEDLDIIVKKLHQKKFFPLLKKFDGVFGIPAGGLVLATCLHYRLGLPLLLAPTKNTLIVDDIVDTGKTIAHYVEKGNFTISLFFHKQSEHVPDIWLHEKTDKWICFLLWEGLRDKGV